MVEATKVFEDIKHKCESCGAEWDVRMLVVGESGLALPIYQGSDTYHCPECKSGNTIMFSNRPEVEP